MRRSVKDADGGNERGEFGPLCTVAAGFSHMSAQARVDYGIREDMASGWLKIRESSQIETLTVADRVAFTAEPLNDFAIDAVPVKDRSGYRLLRISRKM